MLSNMQGTIFDMDGTLIDSMWLWRDIDMEYLARFGLEMPDDLQEAIMGISITETAHYFKNRFQIEDSIEKMISDWDELALYKYTYEVPLKEGALEFLEFLSKNQIPMAIATSSSNALAEAVLKSHGIKDYFKTVVTGEDIHHGKPQPDIYLEAAKRLNVQPGSCIAFEDLSHGILAALNAGMRVCAVQDSYSEHEVHKKKELAHYYISSYYDIFNETYEDLR